VDVYRARPTAAPGKWGLSVLIVPTTPLPVLQSYMGDQSTGKQQQLVRFVFAVPAAGAWRVRVLGEQTAAYVAGGGETNAQVRDGVAAALALLGLPVTATDTAANLLPAGYAGLDVLADVAGASMLAAFTAVPAGGAGNVVVVDDNLRRASYNWGIWVVRCVVRDLEWMDTPIVEEPVEEEPVGNKSVYSKDIEEESRISSGTSETPIQPSSHSTSLPRGYYVINEIISARGVVGKTREYRVSWEGYGPEENTWEAEGNLPKRTVTEAIARNEFPDNLPKDTISYPLHVKEIISVQKILNTRQVGARTFLILMNGDPSERLTKVDVEYMPIECLTHQDIWSSQEIFRQGCAVFKKFRRQ
jgi:hypothetical protein